MSVGEVFNWLLLALCIVATVVAYYLKGTAPEQVQRLRMVLAALVYISTAVISGYLALGGGVLVVSGHEVTVSRYALYAFTHPLVLAFISFTLNPDWGLALISGIIGLGTAMPLWWGSRDDTEDANWFFFIPAGLSFVFWVFWSIFFLPTPSEFLPNVSRGKQWLVRILSWAAIAGYLIGYVIDATWTNAIEGDQNLMTALYVGWDVIVKVLVLLALLYLADLYEAASLGVLTHGALSGTAHITPFPPYMGNAQQTPYQPANSLEPATTAAAPVAPPTQSSGLRFTDA